ncbi:MmyB family transcriptional regulator [Brachybacterium paraconglomeratum]|uniref:MmyB family transcriptional regulator n=1 Tax=Brachybacterium paraconglomeratum TaxID=173362 RepID=UPI003FD1CB81
MLTSSPTSSTTPTYSWPICWWSGHDVRTHGSGTKRFRHPVVGEAELAYEELAVTAEPGRVMLVHTAEPRRETSQLAAADPDARSAAGADSCAHGRSGETASMASRRGP